MPTGMLCWQHRPRPTYPPTAPCWPSTSNRCLRGRELYLIRNLSRGRGVSFFDDYVYYPDFIVWLVNKNSQHGQHVIFLDPKGLVRYGPTERQKVKLHTDIKLVEKRVQVSNPALHLHAYVLSVTAPAQIGDEWRPLEEWKRRGVYFLDDSDCLKEVIESALTLVEVQ